MTAAEIPAAGGARAAALPRRSTGVLAFARRQPVAALALLFIVALALASTFADVVSPYDPFTIDFSAMLQPPSTAHWFGTDNFGRDVFTRVLYGGRTALAIGILASALGSAVGGSLGLVSAFVGGRFDFLVQRFLDVLLSFPIIVLAVVAVAMLGKTFTGVVDFNLIIAIAIPIVPKVARVVRASALSVREMPYIDAARALGFSARRIVFRHIAPNVFAPFIIMFAAYVAQAILLEASLSFLGLGTQPPTPSLGLMLSEGRNFLLLSPWSALFAGFAILFLSFGFNLLGDALRDTLDPRLRGRE